MARKKEFNPSGEHRLVIDKYISYRNSLRKSEHTLTNEELILNRFGAFLGSKDFKDATENDMQRFFNGIKALSSYDLFGIKIIGFYRWLLKLEKKERPANMKWFEHTSKEQKERQSDPEGVKKYFVTPEEYKTILEENNDVFGMWQGLWETYYLSGGRLSEVQGMKIKDVKIKENNVSIILRQSKTIPREVPLCQRPELLIRWLGNHPNRDNPDANLWISLSNKFKNHPKELASSSIVERLITIRKRTNIKDTLSVHCYRKTRATLMFNERSKDGGLVYSDTHIAKFFGWKPATVTERRQEYDLTTQEDLKNLVFGHQPTTTPIETYDIIKAQKEMLEQKHEKEIDQLKKEVTELKFVLSDAVKTIKMYGDVMTETAIPKK